MFNDVIKLNKRSFMKKINKVKIVFLLLKVVNYLVAKCKTYQ